jgi:hypothetical protein
MAKRNLLLVLIGKDGTRYPIEPFTARRKKAAFRKHTHELGYLALAWNQLHHNLSLIFAFLLKSKDQSAAQAIWHSLESDILQRKMLRALLTLDTQLPSPQRIPLPKIQREEILWILNQIDSDLRHKRNNAIHAPLGLARMVEDGKVRIRVEAHLNPQNPRSRPLRGKDLLAEFRTYADQAERLATYATAIRRALTVEKVPWPDRPRQPQARKKKQKSRRVSGQPRQRPPGSSQG